MAQAAANGKSLAYVLQPDELLAVEEFKRRILAELPGQVKDIILFGSKARGDAHPGSDIDLLVIVERGTPEVDDIISDLMADTHLEKRIDISALDFTSDQIAEWTAIGTPLMRNVAEEGIVLKGGPVMVGKGDPAKVVQGLIESAYGRLRSARAVREIGEYGNAMSLVYYAFLDVADAALAARTIRTKSHAGTISLFGLHFTKTGLVDAKYSRWFKRAHKFRLEADYERKQDFTLEQVNEAIEQAAEFVGVIESLLPSLPEN
ncbi:MAG: nucleotidyltransferase domain-containing protein [Anaerolineales bacterium]|nr:nucleotidyltransferase domain-containing protein [Anaerolineales bacterium]